MSSWYLSTAPSVASTSPSSSSSSPSEASASTQSRVSAMPGALARPSSRSSATNWAASRGEALGHLGQPHLDDRHLALDARVVDPVVEAAAPERVVQLPGPVRGEDHERPLARADRAELGDGHLKVGQELEQERLELVVGPVDLVDQQHRGPLVVVLDGVEQRAADHELAAEDVAHPLGGGGVGRLQRPDVEHLAGVVPVVEGVGDVDALVALEADQARVQHVGQRLRALGLADARLTLEQHRLAQGQRDAHHRGEPAVGQVGALAQSLGYLVDGDQRRRKISKRMYSSSTSIIE